MFTGHVVEVDTVEYDLVARIETDEVFKGMVGQEFFVATSRSSASCGYNDPWARFEVGEDFLLFAFDDPDDGTPRTTLCSRNNKLAEAQADLAVLRSEKRTNFLPISAANFWSFIYEPFAPGEQATVSVTRVAVEDDRTYFRLDGIPSPADSLWLDSWGNLWGLQDDVERILLDFYTDDETSYGVRLGEEWFTVSTAQGLTVHVALGRFDGCTRFDFERESGEVWSLYLAPGVGPILLTGGGQFRFELESAVVSGKEVVPTEPPVVPEPPLRASVHPNPAEASAVISVEVARPDRVRISAHDALGREVGVLNDGSLGVGAHSFSWDLDSLPAGTYFVRIRSASGGEIVLSVAHL